MWTALARLWNAAGAAGAAAPPRSRAALAIPIDLAARYQPGSGAVAETLGPDLMLLDLERGGAFRLNATGRFVYEQLRHGQTPAASARALAARHDVPVDRAERDVAVVLEQLLHAGLVAPATEVSCAPAS